MKGLLYLWSILKNIKFKLIEVEDYSLGSGHENLVDVSFICKIVMDESNILIKVDCNQIANLLKSYNMYNQELKNIIMQFLSAKSILNIHF